MSIAMAIVRQIIRVRSGIGLRDAGLAGTGTRPRRAAKVPPALGDRYDCYCDHIGGFKTVTLQPAWRHRDAPHLIYLHGGAYVHPLVRPHWSIIDALIKRTGTPVTVPMYPLAPEYTVDDALAFLDEVMAWRNRRDGRPVILIGDSAGGGLALSYALRQRDTGAVPASALILFSPWLDITLSNPLISSIEPRDFMHDAEVSRIYGEWWAGSRDTSDPVVNPLHASLAGLPPVHTFIGDRDIVLPDAELMHSFIQ